MSGTASLCVVSAWNDGEAMPSGAARRLSSRFALLGSLGFGVLALGIAAAVILLAGPTHKHASSHGQLLGQITLVKKKSGSGAALHHAAASSSAALRHPAASASAAPHHAAAGGSAAAHGLVAEVRDPEESKSFPAPPSVHHSAAKTPERAGELKVAAGAASDSEIRSELARMKQIESAANDPAKMSIVPGGDSIVGDDGTIPIPTEVPEVVQRVIAGANAIANFPYRYGGGHASFVDNAYDCSGSVSYALAAGGLIGAPETSGQLESWGAAGPGKWITVYANAGHTYMYVNVGGAWMLYDTAGRSGVFASRWQPSPVDNSGYVVRHWPGL